MNDHINDCIPCQNSRYNHSFILSINEDKI